MHEVCTLSLPSATYIFRNGAKRYATYMMTSEKKEGTNGTNHKRGERRKKKEMERDVCGRHKRKEGVTNAS